MIIANLVFDSIQSALEQLPPLLWVGIGLMFLVPSLRFFWGNKIKGWFGEKATTHLSLRRLDSSIYKVFDDLYLPRPDGKGSTQIDHVVLSPFGVFVIETKNYRGWIFGSEKQKNWTQTINGKKFRFQNPLHQNALHVRALAEFLKLDREQLHSLVFFIGDSTFKTELPDNVLDRGLQAHIKTFQIQILDPPALAHCTELLCELERSTDRRAAARAHMKALRARK